ncbi:hypothetical protein BD289DRAFT_136058 [Coniella lustricola]|uniref:PPP4R2-domain-containing protein n=1 Tax=Coniella lustricola TaxID=2025994 RepID=A0A2T3AFG7_9PEZI|nr:hypothetical protein BD289DRAFT_136058 [Coniella lustricola]
MAATMQMESSDEATLRSLAAGDSMDYSTWPLLLATIVSRIDKIAHHDFPIPRLPQPAAPAASSSSVPEPRFLAPLPSSPEPNVPSSSVDRGSEHTTPIANSVESSQEETNKENAAPGPPLSDAQPSSPAAEQHPPPLPSSGSQPAGTEPASDVLPPQITAMLAEITGILNETFHTYPPHTIQRLAELVLEPRRHYRSLPSYLHAVDRIVHVTSGNNIYPLPPAIPDMSHMSVNGVTDAHDDGSVDGRPSSAAVWASSSIGAPIGSDEALGGALLSPIPWLMRPTTNGDDAESDTGSEPGSFGANEISPSSVGGALASSHQQQQNSSVSQHRPGQGQGQQHFERQVRTESTETIEGPNGMGSIETVTVSINGISSLGAAQQQRVITQGELIRQEQRSGTGPAGQSTRGGPVVATVSSATEELSSSPSSTPEDAENDTTMTEGDGEDDEDKNDVMVPSTSATAETGARGPSAATNDNALEKPDEEMTGDNTPSESSSEGPVILTPASTEREASGEPTQQSVLAVAGDRASIKTTTGTKASQKSDAIGQDKLESLPSASQQPSLPEDMDAEPTSPSKSIVSTTPSLGKREAENDLDDELDSKRLKGSPKNEDDVNKKGEDTKADDGVMAEGPQSENTEPTAAKAASPLEPQQSSMDESSAPKIASILTHLGADADADDTDSLTAQAPASPPPQLPPGSNEIIPAITNTTGAIAAKSASTSTDIAAKAEAEPESDGNADADTDAEPNLQIEQEEKAAAVAAEAEADAKALKEDKDKMAEKEKGDGDEAGNSTAAT